jgi:CRP/FNR family cyclic AMP-dependent transcriptional regulator
MALWTATQLSEAETRTAQRTQESWDASFLGQLPKPAQHELQRNSVSVQVSAGQSIYSAFGPARLALVVEGLSRVFASSADGRHVTARYARSGECIGVMSVVTARQTVNAEAVTDCEVRFIDVPTLRRLAATDAGVGWVIAQAAGTACSDAIELMTSNLFGNVRQRVARHLLDLAEPNREGVLVTIDQQAIADAIGSVREVVARALRSLKQEGLIERTPRGLVVLDLAKMHDLAVHG